MMDARAMHVMVLVGRVENVALDEEVLDRAGTGVRHDALHRAIADAQVGGSCAARVVAVRGKIDRRYRLGRREKIDRRMKIRKLVRGSRCRDGDRARRVEAEKPHARIAAIEMHVGSNVDLMKTRDPRQRRREHRPDAVMVNGNSPTYALPSCVSIVSSGGMSFCSSSGGTSPGRNSR